MGVSRAASARTAHSPRSSLLDVESDNPLSVDSLAVAEHADRCAACRIIHGDEQRTLDHVRLGRGSNDDVKVHFTGRFVRRFDEGDLTSAVPACATRTGTLYLAFKWNKRNIPFVCRIESPKR